jgi:hypothetical protein
LFCYRSSNMTHALVQANVQDRALQKHLCQQCW